MRASLQRIVLGRRDFLEKRHRRNDGIFQFNACGKDETRNSDALIK